ncbi:cyclohexa-1,5-dienecarbonyl-CoA hydratase [Geobacter hydrogenophilus]|uniref:Enoyl-CoA hydratase n=1 Tax=Geobacter hydrogenophilus TaxID=40983 RepID=A0A9W6LD36_9BACT|nr:cyclohexa-1,5-dienecarbonyl-CoA hydratase [Geobacter hydrogenophilus]MBT0894472.1 cyclohexa-1,5-dienecarbonyl-CoA hydratase [Geobacter hydrogenophilus]GLI39373.1 enoyl-CoA hydratase [Geobacter hydrogenophilus]
MSESPLKVWLEKDGALLRLRLARPKANIVDAAMIAALQAALTEHLSSAKLRAVLLDAEGPHFSFGASVEEHMPDSCAAMLKSLHALVIQMLECPVPLLVAVRGQCLGGGLEVVAAGNLIFAAPGAMLGQPEIKIGVFAPAASCLLPERIGKTQSEDLLFSGRSISAEEAYRIGLVSVVAEDPEQAAVAYFDEHLAGLSASSLRFAVRAARIGVLERTKAKIAAVEKLYLEELMATHDAVEGLNAFLGKRPAAWQDR